MEKDDEYKNTRLRIKELQQELERAQQQFTEFKKNFIASISHELRTPLNSIIGFSRLLVDPGLNKEQREEYFKYVSLGSERLINLVNEMTQLASINTESTEPEMVRFDISKMFDVLYDEFKNILEQRPDNNILLIKRKDIDAHSFIVVSDESKLMQVFHLLLNHVLKNASSGIVEFGYIILDFNYIQFYIEDRRDNSYNMVKDLLYEASEKDDKKLFLNNNPNSAGFGLTISKMIIETFGGDIWIKNNDYNGFTINFILPVNDQAVFIEEGNRFESQQSDCK